MNPLPHFNQYINHTLPKLIPVHYVTHITDPRIQFHPNFNKHIHLTTSNPFFLHFIPKNLSNPNPIKPLCKTLQIPLQQLILFPHTFNHKSIFQVAGYSVPM
ncbi:HAD hydrolase family protein, partial [Staphylococcus epidermidis]|uniref:HAD hydrolase family protein n=1 Tax=Staphylococcus epidermidis TaxID=1282 RepID=UPI0037D9DD18